MCICSQVTCSLRRTSTYEQSMNCKYSYRFPVHYSTSLYILHTYPKHSKKCLNVPFLATKSAVLSTMSVGHRSGRQLQERSSLRCKHRKQRYTQQEPQLPGLCHPPVSDHYPKTEREDWKILSQSTSTGRQRQR